MTSVGNEGGERGEGVRERGRERGGEGERRHLHCVSCLSITSMGIEVGESGKGGVAERERERERERGHLYCVSRL